MQGVADHGKRHHRMHSFFMRDVRLVREECTFQYEKEQDAHKDRETYRECLSLLEQFGEYVDEHVAKQSARRKTDEIKQDAREALLSHSQRKNADERHGAHEEDTH